MKISSIALVATLALLASCTSAPHVQKERDVMRLVDLINAGGVQGIQGLAAVPFAFDSEILYLESDVERLWVNLSESSFLMENARMVSSEPVNPESWTSFARSFDMQNFFSKYTGRDTSLVTVDSDDGRYLLLLERKIKGYPRVRGMRGPL